MLCRNTSRVVCAVTVGAAFNGVFNTGVDANGNGSAATAPGSVDLHYQLIQSADPSTVNDNAIVWGSNPNGGSLNNNVSGWIGPENAGAPPAGTYSYQTMFQIDNGDVASASLTGRMWAGGPGAGTVQAFLNGVETDFILQPNNISTAALFVITNGLQAGSNTLVFTLNDIGGNFEGAIRAELTGIGNALPPGLPTFSSQPPASETVQYGATAVLPVVALGRPPLSYQWLSNGVPISPAAIPSATNQNCTFGATNVIPSQIVGGNFTANYQVVVSNDSGSVTSSVAALTIQIPPLTLALAGEPIWNPTSNETNIIVIFSDAVDPTTATTAGNYSLDNSATVTAAAMGDLPNKVILTTSVLNPATPYTLSVQNVNDSFGEVMSPSPASVPVGLYPVCALWIRADTGVTTDANGVNQWNDMSGNGNNLTQPFGPPYEPQLVANALNGMPVIRFTATNETYMSANDAPSLELTGDMAVFAVANFASLAGNTNGMIVSKTTANQPGPYDYYSQSGSVTFLRGNGVQSAPANSAKAPAAGFAHILDVTMQGTNVTQRLDGNTNGSSRLSTTITDTTQQLYIGTRIDQHNRLNGDLAELIVLSSIPSSNDVAMLENYLATEYHVPTGLNSYPSITQQPAASTNVSQGGTLMVAAAASGNPAAAYQWYDTNNLAIAGQTNTVLVISNLQASDSYYLQATNIFGSVTSTVVSVNTITGLNVGLAPASVAIYAGQTFTYSAAASGTVPFHYQWFQEASPIPNATNASYSAVASLGSTIYSCTVTNAYNGYSSTNAGPVTLIGVAMPTNLYQAAVLGKQPVAYWQLTEVPDNGSGNNGTIAYDYVGGHNGAYSNVVLGLPGFSSLSSTDKAVQFGSFAASNSYAGEIDQSSSGMGNVNFATPSGGNAELSVEAWILVTNTTETAGAGIVTKGYGNGGEQFDLDYNSGFRFFVRDASGSVHAAASAVTLVANNWYHLVGVWDGANGTTYLYINGVTNVVSTGTPAGVGLLTTATTNTVLPGAALVSIGARASAQSVNNYDLQFKGRIDDVAIYNYVLTPTQVRADYVAGVKNAVFSASPTNILFSVAGTNLTLAWPVNHFGWRLLAQTNSLTKGLGTNWATVANSSLTNAVIVPINRNNGSVFYQLTYP